MNNKNNKFKDNVLNAFKKVSPSKIEIENKKVYKKYLNDHKNLFFWKLNFPVSLFDGKKIIDFGCGTGEVDIILHDWGAIVNGFDFNDDSIKRAKDLRDKFKVNKNKLKFTIGDIDSFKIQKNAYDMAVSFGVIAHVPNQKRMFQKMVDSTKNGGFVILGYVEDSGLIQRLFHRAIVRANSQKDENEIHRIALNIFGEHISRSVKYGGRTAKSVINDYLINPAYFGISCKKLDNWADEFGLKFYSTYPNTNLPFVVDSPYLEPISRKSNVYRIYLSLHRLRYIFAQNEDIDVFSNFFSKFGKLEYKIENTISDLTSMLQCDTISHLDVDEQKRHWGIILRDIRKASELSLDHILDLLESTVEELIRLLEILVRSKQSNDKINLTDINRLLFNGYNGLGTTYTIFYKP